MIMPSLESARRIASTQNNNASTIGQIHKNWADFAMESTWWNDHQSKVCYIYDYAHDDSPEMNIGMTYNDTTKTKIDAKIIVSGYGSISKDYPTLYCQFKPSQKTSFDIYDELYYLEEYRQKYRMEDVFCGLYIDAPDKDGIYHRYMICMKDVDSNFQRYFILPCDYLLQWVQRVDNKAYKRSMWCCLRSQSSYNSGIWSDTYFSVQQNQEILYIPTNYISDTIWYVSEGSTSNQRVIVDSPNYSLSDWTPNTWIVSKCERVNIKGRTKITLYQCPFNKSTDYIEKDENGLIVGLWADYYSDATPENPTDTTSTQTNTDVAEIVASTYTVKIGGSYRTLTVNISNISGENVTDKYSDSEFIWSADLDGIELDETRILWRDTDKFNQKKFKLLNYDEADLTKVLNVKCKVDNAILPLTATIKFELSL